MKVTAYNDGHGIKFHKSTCDDLKRNKALRLYTPETFPDLQTAIDAFLDTGDETDPGWMIEEMTFLPCTKQSYLTSTDFVRIDKPD